MMQRDILKSGTGGNLVGTEHMSSRFIDYLYKRSDILSRVTTMEGMTQDIAIPRMTGLAPRPTTQRAARSQSPHQPLIR